VRVIRQSYIIHAPATKVWQALVDPKLIAKWTTGAVTMNDKVGTKFKLWGGDIWGKNLEVRKNKQLVQEWYGGDWERPSIVTISLTYENKRTYIDMLQEDVPEEERDKINKAWKEFYFYPLTAFIEGEISQKA
jgi:activator of HSP90 ATPase